MRRACLSNRVVVAPWFGGLCRSGLKTWLGVFFAQLGEAQGPSYSSLVRGHLCAGTSAGATTLFPVHEARLEMEANIIDLARAIGESLRARGVRLSIHGSPTGWDKEDGAPLWRRTKIGNGAPTGRAYDF